VLGEGSLPLLHPQQGEAKTGGLLLLPVNGIFFLEGKYLIATSEKRLAASTILLVRSPLDRQKPRDGVSVGSGQPRPRSVGDHRDTATDAPEGDGVAM
jgi:hypothetical protein